MYRSSRSLRICRGASVCKGMLLRTGFGILKHLSTKQLWVQGAIQSYGVGVRKIGRDANRGADLLTHCCVPETTFLTGLKEMGLQHSARWATRRAEPVRRRSAHGGGGGESVAHALCPCSVRLSSCVCTRCAPCFALHSERSHPQPTGIRKPRASQCVGPRGLHDTPLAVRLRPSPGRCRLAFRLVPVAAGVASPGDSSDATVALAVVRASPKLCVCCCLCSVAVSVARAVRREQGPAVTATRAGGVAATMLCPSGRLVPRLPRRLDTPGPGGRREAIAARPDEVSPTPA